MKKLKCRRCLHKWYPRKPGIPKTCPECNSPYWQTKSSRVVNKTESKEVE